ncbi:MAG: hypothetical protein ABL886_16920, partial [Rhodoglobus sp.]
MTDPTQLSIRPVIEQAQRLAERVKRELPSHEGLSRASQLIVDSAVKAETRRYFRPRCWMRALPPTSTSSRSAGRNSTSRFPERSARRS